MDLEPKRKVEMPFWGLSLLISSMGLGWLIASFLLGKIQPDTGTVLFSELATDIFKAIFIGSSAGIGINLYLKHAMGETPRAILERSGISEIYTDRLKVAAQFQRLIQDKKRVRRIYIIGASLRDFLTAAGTLSGVWHAITERFMFATDVEAYVQQYGYRDHTKPSKIPILKYPGNMPQYDELMYSLDVIWKHATPGEWMPHHVGTAAAIEESHIRNIFRRENRGALSKRQNECLGAVGPKDTVDILAITGNYYMSNPALGHLREISSNRDGNGSAKVRFAILNPVSQQAILRVVAETSPPERIRETLRSWTWARHSTSKLYQDAHQTMTQVDLWKERGHSFDLHLYCGSIACAMLITPTAGFIEQYVYGRSRKFHQDLALGGEYPVFEFIMPSGQDEERIEQEILTSTFNLIWNCYSVPSEMYRQRNEVAEFEKNLKWLLQELDLDRASLALPEPSDAVVGANP